MKAFLTMVPGDKIEWANEEEAARVAQRLGDAIRLEGCTTIFVEAYRFVITVPGECPPASDGGHETGDNVLLAP